MKSQEMEGANQKDIYNISFDIARYRLSNKKRDYLWSRQFQQIN